MTPIIIFMCVAPITAPEPVVRELREANVPGYPQTFKEWGAKHYDNAMDAYREMPMLI